MSSSLDLLILPLARAGGQEQAAVPGLYVAIPPRRPARFRDRDQLALHLVLEGNAPLSPDQVTALLENLAKTYYNTPGTVTTAQRAIAEALNQFLLDRNLRNASTGQQSLGHLTQIVLRENRLSIAQSGLAHAFLLTDSGTEHVHDLSQSGNGLGLSRTTPIRFSQLHLQANDTGVIALHPPLSWSRESIDSLRGQGPESLRRRLLSQAGAELNAFLIHTQPGKGQLRLLRPMRPTASPPAGAAKSEAAGAAVVGTPAPVYSDLALAGAALKVPPPAPETPKERGVPGLPRQRKGASGSALGMRFSQLGKGLGNVVLRAGSGIGAVARQVLPDSSLFTIPSSMMIFVAVAVPLVVVTIAAMVYFQRGRAAQFNVYFVQAQAAAVDAEAKTDPQDLRQAWEATLAHLDQAEFYQATDDSRQLRSRALSVLDQLDVIDRLDFKPAIVGGLPEETVISRMIANENILFLLNATDGIVQRAVFTSEGYRLDSTFQCGPGPTSGIIVGAIIDIAPAPEDDEQKTSIIGIDANGIILECTSGETPTATPLQPPDINWGSPRAITVDGNNLYVLDPQTDAVWVYREMNFTQSPRLFFDQQIPEIEDAIDLAANQGDLYLLHADGQLTTCVFSGLETSPTRCQEPAIFTDPRQGRQSGSQVEGSIFSEIKFSPPPEPSLYFLVPDPASINHFSVRLTYDRQYRSQDPLPNQPATAFAIDKSSRIAFLALADQVYYAAMP
jgi:hypothetical protein